MHHSPVLLIDDSPDCLEILMLELSSNFECRGVSSRDEALLLLKSGYEPACIVTDCSMPGMSLDEFMKELAPRRMPFVMVSAHNDALALASKFGITRVLKKPAEPEPLTQAIRQAIGSGEHRAVSGYDRSVSNDEELRIISSELRALSCGLREHSQELRQLSEALKLLYRELSVRSKNFRQQRTCSTNVAPFPSWRLN